METHFDILKEINRRPELFEYYTVADLWTDEHTSGKMLEHHLDENVDISSRRISFIDASVKWMVSRFGIGEGFRIVDLGCGPGLYTTRLARAGALVTGVDFSSRSIRHAEETARQEKLAVSYVNENYLDWQPEGPYDLAMMIMCDFCALSPRQRKTLLEKCHGLLAAGGALLLDVYSLVMFNIWEEYSRYEFSKRNGFWKSGEYFVFQNTFKYNVEKVFCDKYTIVTDTGTKTICNWLSCFTPESIRDEFAECGFQIENILGDVAGGEYNPDEREFAVVAKKRA